MIKDKTVIVEYAISLSNTKRVWAAVEVAYGWDGENLSLGAPINLSVPEGPERDNANLLFCALIAAKGEFYHQVAKAAIKASKRKEGK